MADDTGTINVDVLSLLDGTFLGNVEQELENARTKFPSSAASHAALVGEVGELAKALMYEPWENVYAEAVQVATVACRVANEGDPLFDQFRADHGNQDGPMMRE